MRIGPAVALLACASCIPGEGPLMAPGQDCLGCHRGGETTAWTAAGTWTRGARVTITDANGKVVSLRGNKVGNFYTAEDLAPPLAVSVDGVPMPTDGLTSGLRYGGCNVCHAGPAVIDLALMAPGRDCLVCHDGALAARFTVAGTWRAGSGDVVVVDAGGQTVTMTPNAAGNFYATTALAFPLRRVSVGGSSMDPPPAHGGCNACHGSGEPEDD